MGYPQPVKCSRGRRIPCNGRLKAGHGLLVSPEPEVCSSQADPGGDRRWLQGRGLREERGGLFALSELEAVHIAQRGVRSDVFRVAGKSLFHRRDRLLIRAFLGKGRADIVVRRSVIRLA